MDLTGFERRAAKQVNFGGMYGIGAPTASNLFGWELDEAKEILNTYHTAAPYIRTTRDAVSNVCSSRGFIFTILGRKARLHTTRSLYSMFNRLIQGSAADVMKKAIVDAEEQGLFDELVLHLTVHDELDVSYQKTKRGEEALKELTHCMEETVKIDVPLLVDCHTGDNWAEAD
jgi:DNA polymerase-1